MSGHKLAFINNRKLPLERMTNRACPAPPLGTLTRISPRPRSRHVLLASNSYNNPSAANTHSSSSSPVLAACGGGSVTAGAAAGAAEASAPPSGAPNTLRTTGSVAVLEPLASDAAGVVAVKLNAGGAASVVAAALLAANENADDAAALAAAPNPPPVDAAAANPPPAKLANPPEEDASAPKPAGLSVGLVTGAACGVSVKGCWVVVCRAPHTATVDSSVHVIHTGATSDTPAKGLAAAPGAPVLAGGGADDASAPPPLRALTILRVLRTSSDAFSKLLGSISS